MLASLLMLAALAAPDPPVLREAVFERAPPAPHGRFRIAAALERADAAPKALCPIPGAIFADGFESP